jgi:WD40 repeat protein
LNKYDIVNDISCYNKNNNVLIAVGHYDGKITIWNYEGKLIKEIKKSNNEIRNINFSPDGNYLLSAGFDGTIKLFDVNANFDFCGKLEHDDKVVSAKWHPDLPFILSTSADRTARLWEPTVY